VDISPYQSLTWISRIVSNKLIYWKSQAWPFATHLKVVQVIMILIISYFFPLLPWTKKSFDQFSCALKYTLWKKESNIGISWVSWFHVCTPKHLGGTGSLNLEDHMVARRFSLLKEMCSVSQPWVE
jgi:hypothetical protein